MAHRVCVHCSGPMPPERYASYQFCSDECRLEAQHERRYDRALREFDETAFWEQISICVCEHAKDLFGITGDCEVCCWTYPYPSVVPVYRRAYQIANGPILPMKRLYVCHKCDNPFCVNFAHLVLGAPRDNHLDMLTRGRKEGRGISGTMKPKTVQQIRQELAAGHKRKDVAARYNVSVTTIANIINGKTYQWIAYA